MDRVSSISINTSIWEFKLIPFPTNIELSACGVEYKVDPI